MEHYNDRVSVKSGDSEWYHERTRPFSNTQGSGRLGTIELRHSAGRPALRFVKDTQPFEGRVPLLACGGAALRTMKELQGRE